MSEIENTAGIQWQDWSEDAFAAARSEGKPVLLTLGATWCHWCHVMDETAYADERVIQLVNAGFIPVRVDVDERPDISLRYNQGTYPSVAFLSGDGDFLAGRPYTPADEMADLLERISSGEFVAEPDDSVAGNATLPRSNSDASVDAVLARLEELYDTEFGGFGFEPKQPPWEALFFLTSRYGFTGDRAILATVEHTLQGMWHGIYDRKDRGFFRYSVSRDWKIPHYEKMLVTNASLLLAYLEGYQITRRSLYKTAADGILDYLQTTLFDPDAGMYHASQDADEPFYLSSWKDRDSAKPPPIDRTFYAGWNALVAQSLIKSADVLGRPDHLRLATDILEKLWRDKWSQDQALSRRVHPSGDAASVLADQAHFLKAWLALYQSTGNSEALDRAVRIADTVHQLFGATDGGFYDTTAPQSFESRFLRRERSVLDNSAWAEALLSLSHLTGDPRYSKQAADALDVFQSVVPGKSYLGDHTSRRMEEDEEALFLPAGAAWGRAKDFLEHGPVSMVLVGDSAKPAYARLHRAALRVYAPHRLVQPLDTERHADQILRLGFPLNEDAALYVCMGSACLAPITTPDGVRALARSRPWVGGSL